jgi:hypothetical protein
MSHLAVAHDIARREHPAPPRCLAPHGPHRPRPREVSANEDGKNADVFVGTVCPSDPRSSIPGHPRAPPSSHPLRKACHYDYMGLVPGAALWPVFRRPRMAGFQVSTEDAKWCTHALMRTVEKSVRQSVSLPPRVARRVHALAQKKNASANRVIVELIESGLNAQEQEKKRFLDLADRLTRSTDAAEQKRLKEELARMTFGG